jgi:hypothetical protein
MPEPIDRWGGFGPGTKDFSDYLYKMGGEEAWQELLDYQAGRSTTGPRAGYNYRTKKARDPLVAQDLQERYDALYEHWRSRGWTPKELEVPGKTRPGPTGDPLIDEAERLSGGK